jgi:GT2 family glycosyltransferase
VVDNASTDGTPQMVERTFPNVRLIVNRVNRYYGRAQNQALGVASGTYFGILNSDTMLKRDTIVKMLDFMGRHPDAGAATCRYVRDDGAELMAEAHNYWCDHSLLYNVLCRNEAGWKLYTRLRGMPKSGRKLSDCVQTDVVSDTFLFAPTEALRRIGGYDERLMLYATEDELCARLRDAGWNVYFYPGTEIVHSLSRSVHQGNPFRMRWIFAADSIRYFQTRGSAGARVLAAPVLAAAYLIDAAVILTRRGRWK